MVSGLYIYVWSSFAQEREKGLFIFSWWKETVDLWLCGQLVHMYFLKLWHGLSFGYQDAGGEYLRMQKWRMQGMVHEDGKMISPWGLIKDPRKVLLMLLSNIGGTAEEQDILQWGGTGCFKPEFPSICVPRFWITSWDSPRPAVQQLCLCTNVSAKLLPNYCQWQCQTTVLPMSDYYSNVS